MGQVLRRAAREGKSMDHHGPTAILLSSRSSIPQLNQHRALFVSTLSVISARANFSLRTAEIAVTMWFIEGHVMFQIRGQQNEPTHELPFATTKAHMWAHVKGRLMGNLGKQGCPLSGGWGAWLHARVRTTVN